MDTPWYHRTSLYQIYPRSFQDSRADGIGDLQGIIHRLDYLRDLGVETLWISPFFSSPQADFGYDVSDYTSVAPEFGTMQDALQLIDEVHRRGMRVVFDLVMNHTSDRHPWFLESRASRTNPRADWYLWRDRPNNWQSMTGGSGWHFSEARGQYYWASFLPFQPDLNYRNPDVKQAMLDQVRFWLEKGVDGYRLDIFNVIYKDADFRDNPVAFKFLPSEADPSGYLQEFRYSLSRPESFEFAKELRSACDRFGERMLIGEVSGSRRLIRRYLGDETGPGLGLVFDFAMLNFQFNAAYFHELIREMEAHYPHPRMPVYVFSNHDRHRSMHRLGGDMRKARLLVLLQLTVRGVPCLYYGEEIGMTDLPMPFHTALDPIARKFGPLPRWLPDRLGLMINRDEVRTPMQWDGSRNAGFSAAERTWLPLHDDHARVNVEAQGQDPHSLLNTVRRLLQVRRGQPALQEGSLELLDGLPPGVLGYARSLEGHRLIVLMNFDSREKSFPFEASSGLLHLSTADTIENKTIHLDGFGGMILD